MAIISNYGTVSWANTGTSASLISIDGSTSQGLWFEGTQDQLNATLAEITINKPCAGSYKIYAQVTDSGFLQHPETNHLYKYSNTSLEFDPAVAEAAANPLVSGGNNTFGYMATVTDTIENILVATMFGRGWLGASDAATEDDWKWVTGPDAGTSFYSGRGDSNGAVLPGKFAGWASGEPNNSPEEDYAEILSDGRWNDIQGGDRNYTTEWGGMPGDDLSSVIIAKDFIDVSVQGAFTGNGTQADPYLIPDATALYAVSGCGGASTYFKQTANITLPANWGGDQQFQGHYDGNGKTITYAENMLVTHDNFGVWGYAPNSDSTISDLTVTGNLISTSYGRVGLLLGGGDAALTDITVTGSITTSDGRYDTGGVAGEYGGDITRAISSVDITSTSDGNGFGGVVGYYWGTMRNSSWDGDINVSGGGTSYAIGGLVGETDCADIYDSRAEGTITVSNQAYNVGGAMGWFCGDAERNLADVDIVAIDTDRAGGLVGYLDGYITQSAALGDVTGDNYVGGLAGETRWSELYDVYAHGNVLAGFEGGSLVGHLGDSNIYRAYATGVVTAPESRGLYGAMGGSGLTSTHWVPEQSTVPVRDPLENGEVPYTAADSKSLQYYVDSGYSISADWEDTNTWTICDRVDDGYPFLTALYTEDPCALQQTLTPTPLIVGSGVEGAQLTGTPGAWDAGVSLTFAWLLDGAVIANETNPLYVPVASDVGKTVTFQVTSTKAGYRRVVKVSAGKVITAKPVVPVVPPTKQVSVVIGGFAGNAWWMPAALPKGVAKFTKANKKAKAITCVGIVAPGGSKTWLKTLGLKRAALACGLVKSALPKVKVTLTYAVAKKTDTVQRGVKLVITK